MADPKGAVILGPDIIVKNLVMKERDLDQILPVEFSLGLEEHHRLVKEYGIGWVKYYPRGDTHSSSYVLILINNQFRKTSYVDYKEFLDDLPQIFIR